MRCYCKIVLPCVLAAISTASLHGQQRPPAQPGQGQPGQFPAGQPQTGTPTANRSGQQGSYYYGGIGQTPWFNNPDIRQHFNLTDQQYNQLNKAYGESYGHYQQGINNLGTALTDQQRTQKMDQAYQDFHKNFSTNLNGVLTDAQQRQRYNQLYLQYQGFNAFADPTVQQKLNLTPMQQLKMSQYSQDWQKEMNQLGQTYQTNSETATSQYKEMRKQAFERMNGVLTPEQQRSWQEIAGQPYNFQPNVYFQTNTGANSSGANNPNTAPQK